MTEKAANDEFDEAADWTFAEFTQEGAEYRLKANEGTVVQYFTSTTKAIRVANISSVVQIHLLPPVGCQEGDTVCTHFVEDRITSTRYQIPRPAIVVDKVQCRFRQR